MTRLGAFLRRREWLPGVAAVVAVLLLHGFTDVIEGLERRWYDHGIRTATRTPSDEVAVVAIDNASVTRLGRWPWSRDVLAQMIDRLSAAGARAIVLALPLAEPQADPGLAQMKQLAEVIGADTELVTHPVLPILLQQSAQALDGDAHLARSLEASRRTLVEAELPAPGAGPANAGTRMPAGAARATLLAPPGSGLAEAPTAHWPLTAFAQASAGVAQVNTWPDGDGVLRSHALFVAHEGRAVPSLALLAAARQRGLGEAQLRLLPDRSVQLGPARIPTEGAALARTHFYDPNAAVPPFVHDSFQAVHSGAIPASRYARKLVLIGLTANGAAGSVATPVAAMSPLDVLAHQTSALLSGHVVARPAWGQAATLAAVAAVLAYLLLAVPRLASISAIALTGAIAIALMAAGHLLLTQAQLWVACVLPVAALLLGHGALMAGRLAGSAQLQRQQADVSGAQAQRRLGLSMLQQGQHELAWDQLRRVPMALLDADEASALMQKLYELGVQFERQRQFALAESVYAHLVRHDQSYRDVAQRLLRTRSLALDTQPGAPASRPAPLEPEPARVVGMGTGPLPASMATGTSIPMPPVLAPAPAPAAAAMAGAPLRPTLGRFRLERELGRGAMGAVYLGVDPQAGRPVAIKTMALTQEFDGEHLEDARQRFLREAETAGRLRHPDIVTIVDAGEDRDLAYIAMELLSGYDLSRHTRSGSLLPVTQVLAITARVAEALAFAHKNGVVHRDVKPANVMIDPAADQVKVTDFGIARITDSSKTRTGAVLGTPSYMSPEQLAGRRLDGRSDLYSLGVMLFQLLTGQLPLRGESMAELMYAIANTPAPDIRTLRADLPQTLGEVVALALEKRPEVRYADGQQLAADLRTVIAMIDEAVAADPAAAAEAVAVGLIPAPTGAAAPAVAAPAASAVPATSATPSEPAAAAPALAAQVPPASAQASLASAQEPPPARTPPQAQAPVTAQAAPASTRPTAPAQGATAVTPAVSPPEEPTPVKSLAALPQTPVEPAPQTDNQGDNHPAPAASPRPVPAPPPPSKGVRGVWRTAARAARRDAQAELFADTQPSMPAPLDEGGFGHNRPG